MKTGRIVIPLVLLLIWIPFVMQTDLYPLFRFGMFAEPVKREIQTESFILRIIDQAGNQRLVAPRETGIRSLAYLMRNYYYRHETDTLLRRINRITHLTEPVTQWQLLRIVSQVSQHQPDTTVVDTFNVPTHE